MHQRHVASAALVTLVVIGEVVLHMTMFAVDAQGAAVSLVHDQEQPPGRNLLERIDLDILEYLPRRILFMPGNLLGNLLHESVIVVSGKLYPQRMPRFCLAAPPQIFL